MTLYSYKTQYPDSNIPERIRLSDGNTRTDSSTFTPEELIDAGYIIVEDPPIYDEETHKLIWSGTAFERVGLTDLEIAAKTVRRWAEIREVRNSKIREVEWRILRNQSESRLGLEPTDDIQLVDTYIQALRDLTKQSDDPLEIVWPHESHAHDESTESTHTHDDGT
mgnify:CR=1 FL=1|jgi:hypothetical protein